MSVDEMDAGWVPAACTLPTAERPLRSAEFDELFAASLTRVARPATETVSLQLDPVPGVAARAASLAVRETDCCSFFSFTLTAANGELRLDVSVPPGQVEVLDALAARAATAAGSRS